MTKFESKEELIKGIESTFNLLDIGKLSMEDLENLVVQTKELYERAIILRFKAYEEKVFGEIKEVIEDFVPSENTIKQEEQDETASQALEEESENFYMEKE